ncbi:MAG: 50S ribosomal protein L9 [Candidatus Omnitrophica bacterium]|nr:50S ribosomal protein L9 [Candidatus Omnitrophota bacterium]
MEVILTKDIEKLGKSGDIVSVKPGFARNFLFPRNLALRKNQANLKKIEEKKKKQALLKEKERKLIEELKSRLEGSSFTLAVKVYDEDKLYGSISARDIVQLLKSEGLNINKDMVALDAPIRATGVYDIKITLSVDSQAMIKLWVVKK